MYKLIQKVIDYFKLRKLKKELKELKHDRACYHYNMHFDDLNQNEIDDINNKLLSIERQMRIIESLIHSYQ